MKKLVVLISFFFLVSCEYIDFFKKVDLTGVYCGRVKGWAQPINFDLPATWEVVQTGDSIKATVYHTLDKTNFNFIIKGVVTSDSTFTASMIETPVGKINQANYLTGKIENKGNVITCVTADNDPSRNYFRVNYFLNKLAE